MNFRTANQSIGIFIVDSDKNCRATFRRRLSSDANVSIVGSTESHKEAIDCIRRTAPQIVLLEERGDISATAKLLEEIGQLQKAIHTVACVSHDASPSVEDSLRKLGVTKIFRKWDQSSGSKIPNGSLAPLLEIIDGLSESLLQSRLQAPHPSAVAGIAEELPTLPSKMPSLIAVGCSTGGPEALGALLRSLPPSFDTPIVIVQHIPADFSPRLASRLSNIAKTNIRVAEHGMQLTRGLKLLAPGDFHMKVVGSAGRSTIELTQEEKVQSCRPAVDVLFRSVAKSFGKSALGVVLTGMGSDGAEGAKALADTQADIWVQDETSSVVWGMPKAALDLCPTAKVLNVSAMGTMLTRMHECLRRRSIES